MSPPPINPLKSYALVDSKGKVIEYFRTKVAATQMKPMYDKIFYEKLKVVKLK